MNIWKHRRFAAMCVIDVLVIYAVLHASHIGGLGETPNQLVGSVVSASEQQPEPRHKLIFMLTTGFEDLREVELCLHDVKVAKASGYLADVILIVRGRGVDALANLNGRPSQIADLAREVKASGVRIIASDAELTQYGVSAAKLDPVPSELIPDAAARMSEYVSQGYEVIRY